MTDDEQFIGNDAAAAYIGVAPSTWRAWTARRETSGVPEPVDRQIRGGHAIPVYSKAQLDAWKDSRRGKGWARGIKLKPEKDEK